MTLTEQKKNWTKSCKYPDPMLSPTRFCFLNTEHSVQTREDWNNSQYEKLWLYQLHYFDHLGNSEKPFFLSDNDALINRWIDENPPVFGNGWEPYPLSRRIVNWIKWHLMLKTLTHKQLTSLYLQASYLRKRLEYHLLGNHLLANTKALIFAGLFFKTHAAEKWYKKGMRIYEKELSKQILKDGGHVEQSPMYHAFILEDLLDIYNLHQVYDRPIPTNWNTIVLRMLDWLWVMTHPDGNPAFFNDSILNQAPTYAALSDYASSLGIACNLLKPKTLHYLNDSGYVRVNEKNFSLITNIGNVASHYLTGHFHADTLSFELCHETTRVFVNAGISTYSTGPLRDYQRSTPAHNTLTINQSNSSDVWSAFRCGQRASIVHSSLEKNEKRTQITATHNGYNKFPYYIFHSRTWLVEPNHIKITDTLTGNGKETYPVQIHLHIEPSFYVIQLPSNELQLVHNTGSPFFRCFFPQDCHINIKNNDWFPEFGKKIANKKIEISCNTPLPKSIEWHIFHEPQD